MLEVLYETFGQQAQVSTLTTRLSAKSILFIKFFVQSTENREGGALCRISHTCILEDTIELLVKCVNLSKGVSQFW